MSEGTSKYDKCLVREIELTEVYRPIKSGSNIWIREDELPTGASKSDYEGLAAAVLHCPRTEVYPIESYASDRIKQALDSLRSVAGQVTCTNCMYSGKTPAEVEYVRAEEANARAQRVKAQIAEEEVRQEYAKLIGLGMPLVQAIEQRVDSLQPPAAIEPPIIATAPQI